MMPLLVEKRALTARTDAELGSKALLGASFCGEVKPVVGMHRLGSGSQGVFSTAWPFIET
jgi:hypothetical protein